MAAREKFIETLVEASPKGWAGLAIGLYAAYYLSYAFYNIFLHPLAGFPGPIFSKFSRLPYVWNISRGWPVYWIKELHDQYGDVVRVAPDELSYTNEQVWKDVYGHRLKGKGNLNKYLAHFNLPGDPNKSILTADEVSHGRIRKIFSNAFSERAMQQQEELFVKYVDMLLEKLNEKVGRNPNAKLNMVDMFNFTTFDVMGDLTFGEPLYMLENDQYSPWVTAIFGGLKALTVVGLLRFFPFLNALFEYFLPQSLKDQEKSLFQQSNDRVDRRLQKPSDRPDIWGLTMREGKGLTREEMQSNAPLFMIGGTETTASTLAGMTYYLLRNPETMRLLVKEIRDAFPSSKAINMMELSKLKYLNSCIEEALRLYPPVPGGQPRFTPPTGAEIAGRFVPGDTVVYVHNYASYHSARNFQRPEEFLPERWTSSEFASDNKEVFQPFSFGPRNCIGKNMAYHELRLIAGKILWNFDLALCNESKEWMKDQKVFTAWQKPPLFCKLIPVQK